MYLEAEPPAARSAVPAEGRTALPSVRQIDATFVRF